MVVAVDPSPSFAPSEKATDNAFQPIIYFFGAVAVGTLVMMGMSKRKLARNPEPPEYPKPISQEEDPKGYLRAMARNRQAISIQKSVMFMKSGDPAPALVELGRALHDNSICRTPILAGLVPKEDLLQLYRLHIKNSEVPPSFAVLLQLQEMLGLSQVEAEKVELEVLETPSAFSI